MCYRSRERNRTCATFGFRRCLGNDGKETGCINLNAFISIIWSDRMKQKNFEGIITNIIQKHMNVCPIKAQRCAVGQGNYVYIVECPSDKYVLRLSEEKDAYKDTVYWLERLADLEIPVPRVLAKGHFETFEYIILTYFEGKDIGLVYTELTDKEKRNIAREIVAVQKKMEDLKLENMKKRIIPVFSRNVYKNPGNADALPDLSL